MSFSTIIASLLSEFLGDFVEGFDASSMELNVLRGEATVTNLQLKRNLLDKFNLPVTVKEGHLGKVYLKVPWHDLQNESAIIRITDIFLLAASLPDQVRTRDEQEQLELSMKLARLSLAKLMQFDQIKEEKKDKEVEPGIPNIFEGVVVKVVDNMQVFIDNIHIRYEDNVSNPQKPFSFGVVIKSIHMQSADEDWKPNFNSARRETMYKLLSVKNFSVYFDTEPSCLLQLVTDNSVVPTMRNLIEEHNKDSISVTIKAIVNTTRTVVLSNPQVILDIAIDDFQGKVDQEQLHRLGDVGNWITLWQRKNKYGVFKLPEESVETNPVAWWKYCFEVTRTEIRKKMKQWNWDNMKKLLAARTSYIAIYKKLVKTPELITPEEQELVDNVHKEYSYETILSWRKLANAALKDDEEKDKFETKVTNFFNNLFAMDKKNKIDKKQTKAALKDLYRMIGYQEDTYALKRDEKDVEETKFPVDYVQVLLNVNLSSFSFKLEDCNDKTTVIDVLSQNAALSVQLYPKSQQIRASVHNFEICEYSVLKGETLRILTTDHQHAKTADFGDVLSANIFVHPFDKDVELSVEVQTQPIMVNFSRSVIDRVAVFFDSVMSRNKELMDRLTTVTNLGLEEVQKKIEAELKYALEDQPAMSLDLDINSLTVVAPVDVANPFCSCIVFDTGHLMLSSDLKTRKDSAEVTDLFFDCYRLKIEDIHSYSSPEYAKWRNVIDDYYLLPNFDIEVMMKVRRVPVTTLPNFMCVAGKLVPLTIISGQIPALSVWIGTNNLCDVLAVVKELSKPLNFLKSKISEENVPKIMDATDSEKMDKLGPKTVSKPRAPRTPPRSTKLARSGSPSTIISKSASATVPLIPYPEGDPKNPLSTKRSSSSPKTLPAVSRTIPLSKNLSKESFMTPRGVLQALSVRNRQISNSTTLEAHPTHSPTTPGSLIGSASSVSPSAPPLLTPASSMEDTEEHFGSSNSYSLEVKDVAILKLDFVLHSLNIVLRHKGREGPLKSLIKVQFDKMQLEADINAKKVQIMGHLHYLLIQNVIDWTPDMPPQYLFESKLSEGSSNLLNFKYQWIDARSKRHKGVNNDMEIDLDRVQVTVDRSTLAVLLHSAIEALDILVTDILKLMDHESVNEEFKKQKFLSMIKAEVRKADYKAIIKSAVVEKLKKFVAGKKTLLNFKVCAKEFNVAFLKSQKPFIEIFLTKFDFTGKFLPGGAIMMHGVLGKFSVWGRSLHPKWSEVVFVDSKEGALTVSIEAYPPTMKRYPGYDVNLSIPVFIAELTPSKEICCNKVRINYLHGNLFPMVLYFKQFFQYLKTHFFALILEISHLQAGLMTKDPTEEQPQAPTKAKIDVKMMKGVEIYIPRDATSDEALIMTLDTACIDTHFSRGISATSLFGNYVISATGMQLYGLYKADAQAVLKLSQLIERCKVYLTITVALDGNQHREFPESFVDLNVEGMTALFNHQNFLHLLHVVNDNIQHPIQLLDSELVSVLEKIGAPPIVVPPVELQSYYEAHVLLNIPTFRMSLLDEAILCARETYAPLKRVSAESALLLVNFKTIKGEIIVDNYENLDTSLNFGELSLLYPRAKGRMRKVLSFHPKNHVPALLLRCVSDSLALAVKIDFQLNSPTITPTKEAVDEEYATGHFVEPFAIIQDKFEEIKTRYVRATEEFLTKQGKLLSLKKVDPAMKFNMVITDANFYMLRHFGEEGDPAVLRICVSELQMETEDTGPVTDLKKTMHLQTDTSVSSGLFDLISRKILEEELWLKLPLKLSQTRPHCCTPKETQEISLDLTSPLVVSISSQRICDLLGFYDTWDPIFSKLNNYRKARKLHQIEREKSEMVVVPRTISISQPELRVTLEIWREESGSFVPFLVFFTRNLKVAISANELDSNIHVNLGEVRLENMLGAKPQALITSSIFSKNRNYFLSWSYNWIDPKSSKYNGIENNIHGEIGMLQVLIDRLGMLGLIKSGAETLENTVIFALDHKIFSRKVAAKKDTKTEELKKGDWYRIQIRNKGLAIGLNRQSDIFVAASLSEFQYDMEVTHSGSWKARGSLCGLAVNKTADIKSTKWKGEITKLTQQDDEVLSFSIDSHGIAKEGKHYPGYDILFHAKVSSIRVNIVSSYLSELSDYFKEFTIASQQFTHNFQENIKKLRCEVQGDEYSPNRSLPKLKLSLDLATPYVCIPRSLDSYEHVLIDLGEISIDTAFEENAVGTTRAVYTMVLQNLRMSTNMDSETESGHLESVDFISGTLIKITFTVPIGTKDTKKQSKAGIKEPDLDINIEFANDSNTLMLSGEQMIFLMRTGTGNFLQPVPKVDGEIDQILAFTAPTPIRVCAPSLLRRTSVLTIAVPALRSGSYDGSSSSISSATLLPSPSTGGTRHRLISNAIAGKKTRDKMRIQVSVENLEFLVLPKDYPRVIRQVSKKVFKSSTGSTILGLSREHSRATKRRSGTPHKNRVPKRLSNQLSPDTLTAPDELDSASVGEGSEGEGKRATPKSRKSPHRGAELDKLTEESKNPAKSSRDESSSDLTSRTDSPRYHRRIGRKTCNSTGPGLSNSTAGIERHSPGDRERRHSGRVASAELPEGALLELRQTFEAYPKQNRRLSREGARKRSKSGGSAELPKSQKSTDIADTKVLVDITINGIRANVAVNNKRDTRSSFAINNVAASYPKSQDLLKYLFEFPNGKNSLSCQIYNVFEGNSEVKIDINPLIIYPSVGASQTLWTWAIAFYPDLDSVITEALHSVSKQAQFDQERVKKAPELARNAELKLHLFYKSPKVIVLQYYDRGISPGFIFGTGDINLHVVASTIGSNKRMCLKMVFESANFSRILFDVKANKAIVSLPMLMPAKVQIRYENDQDSPFQVVTLTAEVFSIKLSKKDMVTMVNVFNTWASTVILVQYHIELITIAAHIKRTEKEKIRILAEDNTKKGALVKPAKVNLKDFDGFDFVVIDDNALAGWERNIFSTKIVGVTGSLEFKDARVQMQVDFQELSSNSCNWEVGCWEPTLEKTPLHLDIRINTKHVTANEASQNIGILVPKKMVINFSPSLVKCLRYISDLFLPAMGVISDSLRLAEEFKLGEVPVETILLREANRHKAMTTSENLTEEVEVRGNGKSKREKAHTKDIEKKPAIVIENHLGLDVTICSTKKGGKGQEKLLKAKDGAVSRFEYTPEARTTFDTLLFKISKGSGKGFPFSVNWKSNGTKLYTELTDCPTDNVIVQVTDRTEGKGVILHSTECIKNETHKTIHYKISSPVGDYVSEAKPGHHRGIPLKYLGLATPESNVTLWLTPDPEAYEWGQWLETSQFVRCKSRTNIPGEVTYICLVKESLVRGDAGNVQALWCLSFYPILRMENALATDIKFDFVTVSGKKSKKSKSPPTANAKMTTAIIIEQGETYETIEPLCPTDSLGVSFTLPGFEPSDPVKLCNMKSTKEIKVSSAKGETLKILVSKQTYMGSDLFVSVVIYCKCWIVNHTRLPLCYKRSGSLIPHSPEPDTNFSLTEILYSKADKELENYYNHSTSRNILYCDADKISLSMDAKSWSPEVEIGGLLPVQANPLVKVSCKSPSCFLYLIVDQSKARLNLWRTTIVRIYPAFYLVNNTNSDFRYLLGRETEPHTIKTRRKHPLYWCEKKNFDFCIGGAARGSTFSPVLSLKKKGYFQISYEDGTKSRLLNVEISYRGDCTYAVVNEAEKALYRLHNETIYTAYVKDCNGREDRIPPRGSIDWHWDNPQGDLKLSLKLRRELLRVDSSSDAPCTLPAAHVSTTTMTMPTPSMNSPTPGTPRDQSDSAESLRSNRARHLPLVPVSVQNYEAPEGGIGKDWESADMQLNFNKLKEKQVKGEKSNEVIDVLVVGEGFTKNLICSVKRSNATVADSLEYAAPLITVTCKIITIEVCIIDNRPQELLNITLSDVDITTTKWLMQQSISLKLREFQLDNQLEYTSNPVMVSSKAEGNFFQLALMIDTSSVSVNSFKHLNIELQPVNVCVDVNILEFLLGYLLWLIDASGTSALIKAQKKLLAGEIPKLLVYDKAQGRSVVLYFQRFSISPLKFCITFHAKREQFSEEEKAHVPEKAKGLIDELLQFARLDLKDAQISVRHVEMKHLFVTPQQFSGLLVKEYKTQLILQGVKLLGSQVVKAVNPMSLFGSSQQRKREPRFFDSTGRLYGQDVTNSNMLLCLEGGKYKKYKFLFFSSTAVPGKAILVTNTNVVILSLRNLHAINTVSPSDTEERSKSSTSAKIGPLSSPLSPHKGPTLPKTASPSAPAFTDNDGSEITSSGRIVCPWITETEIMSYRIHPETTVLGTKLTLSFYATASASSWRPVSITFDLPTAELAAECLTHILPFAKLDLEHLYVDVLCMCPPSRRGSSYKDDPLTEHKKKKSGEILYSPSLYKESWKKAQCEVNGEGFFILKREKIDLRKSYVFHTPEPSCGWYIASQSFVVRFRCASLRQTEAWLLACQLNGAKRI